MVLEVVPSGLLEDMPNQEASHLHDMKTLETWLEVPEGMKRLTGDLVLRSLARGLGSEKPFHFVDAASLATFRSHEFQVLPTPRVSVGELLAMCPGAGFHSFEREGKYYLVPLPKGE